VPAPEPFLRANRVTLVAGAVAFALAAAVAFGMKPSRDLTSLWVLLVKLTPFVAASVAIAWLNLDWSRRLRLHLVLPPVCFLVFFTYFVPKIFYYHNVENFDLLYYTVLVLVPFVILSLVLSARLGGASTGTVLRLAGAMILLQLSGIEDLAYVTVATTAGLMPGIPRVWAWADHITVFIGHPPTRNEAFAFIGVHIVLAVLVLTVPGRLFAAALRWVRLVRRDRRRERPGEQPREAEPVSRV
jgi:hypothetical protein